MELATIWTANVNVNRVIPDFSVQIRAPKDLLDADAWENATVQIMQR